MKSKIQSAVSWKKMCMHLSAIVLLLSMVSCYSFTGSSLSKDIKTVSIKTFPNNAANNNPNLSQEFTVALQNRFLQRTTLKGAVNDPDILIEGEIVDYNITPTTISSPTTGNFGNTIQAAQNKLTITVRVRYENKIEPYRNFERSFSDEVVFSSDMDLMQIESSQVQVVNERIINKIFNDIVADW